MFSSSLVISAAFVELTGTTRSTACEYSAMPTCRQSGVMPPQTFGIVWGRRTCVARVLALRRKDQEHVFAHRQARPLLHPGSSSSSVVPG